MIIYIILWLGYNRDTIVLLLGNMILVGGLPMKVMKSLFPFKNRLLWGFLLTILISVLIFFLVQIKSKPSSSLSYYIEPVSSAARQLKITLHWVQPVLGQDGKAWLYKGAQAIQDLHVSSPSGSSIGFQEQEEWIAIEATRNCTLQISYRITLGEKGKHGYRGYLDTHLTVFDGEQVFLFPEEAWDEANTSPIQSVQVTFTGVEGRTAVYPYASQLQSKNHSPDNRIYLKHPVWEDFRNLQKSCYAFGDFKKAPLSSVQPLSVYYSDSMAARVTPQVLTGIENMFSYYQALFGTTPPLTLLLLNMNAQDSLYIMGGAGAHTIGSTFDPTVKRDWELLSHRMFHAFFDNAVKNSTFYRPSQLWMYEGLATYYENISLESLSPALRTSLHIHVEKSFGALFRRYAYMRLKDPQLLSIPPAQENRISFSAGLTEFLHYTQAPLVIRLLEDHLVSQGKGDNQILRYILQNAENSTLQAEDILKAVLGQESSSFVQQYIQGDVILPLWYLGEGSEEDPVQVIKELNEYEYVLWTWFRLEDERYRQDILTADGLNHAVQAAAAQGVAFADAAVEEQVASCSPTVYKLLKQYAYRAALCGLDMSDPLLRYKILGQQENIDRWEQWKQSR